MSPEQLPNQTQNYIKTLDSSMGKKTFNPMAMSTIIQGNAPPKLQFSKKGVGLKTQTNSEIKHAFNPKGDALLSLPLQARGGAMYSSMIVTPSVGPNASINLNRQLRFEGMPQSKPLLQTNYQTPLPDLPKVETVEQIISRYRLSSYCDPVSYLSSITTNGDSYLKPLNSYGETYGDPYGATQIKESTERVAGSNQSSSSYKGAINSPQYCSDYTLESLKNKTDSYGYTNLYEKANQYKPYDSQMPTPSYSSLYGNPTSTGSGATVDYTTPSSNYSGISPFSKKSTAYQPSDSYSSTTGYKSTSQYPTFNAQRIADTNKINSELKESDFQFGKKLGKGQFGQVFLVKHKKTGFICALKVIRKKTIEEEKVEDQLVREIKIQSYLKHNNIVALYGFFSDYTCVYLLMELCTDGHLFDILKKRLRVPEPQVKEIVRDVCIGLDYIHSHRIIHRDIKPQNVILQDGVAKLCDFGWSVFRGAGLRSTYCGTPLYTSPQLIRGEEYDEKIDIWAVGILAYELLIGRIPFKIYSEDDLEKILTATIQFPSFVQVSPESKDFILKVLDRSPGGTIYTLDMLLSHPFLRVSRTQALLDATCI